MRVRMVAQQRSQSTRGGLDLNLRPWGYEPDELPDCSTSANIADCVVPSALASLSACTMEGILSARSMAPM
jgi:hypothetical protein